MSPAQEKLITRIMFEDTGYTYYGDVPIEVTEIWSPSASYIYGRYVFVKCCLLLFIVLFTSLCGGVEVSEKDLESLCF